MRIAPALTVIEIRSIAFMVYPPSFVALARQNEQHLCQMEIGGDTSRRLSDTPAVLAPFAYVWQLQPEHGGFAVSTGEKAHDGNVSNWIRKCMLFDFACSPGEVWGLQSTGASREKDVSNPKSQGEYACRKRGDLAVEVSLRD